MREDRRRHPLAALRSRLGLSAEKYLKLVDVHHHGLDYGHMAIRREKVARWEAGAVTPDLPAQYAMASLHGLPPSVVRDIGWPNWLLLALMDDHTLVSAPWTLEGTVEALTVAAAKGSDMDPNGLLIATGDALTSLTNGWANAIADSQVTSANGRRQIDLATVERLEQRLDGLRRLDDVLGGGELRRLAHTEYGMLSDLAHDATYDAETGRRLMAAIAEAARLTGWLHFDSGHHAAAQSYWIAALRASATAGDVQTGANILGFMAIQTYTVGSSRDAINLVETAQRNSIGRTTPRVRAMLHARAARAHSKAGDGASHARELDAARSSLSVGTHDNDPAWAYWVTEGEIEWIAGSSALDLGRPEQAITHFDAAMETTPGNAFAGQASGRDHVLYLTRRAKAYLALGEVEEACTGARRALDQLKALDTSRPIDELADFRSQVAAWSDVPAAREFLELTA